MGPGPPLVGLAEHQRARRRLPHHQLAPVGAVHLGDVLGRARGLRVELGLELGHAVAKPGDAVLELQDVLDAGERQPELGGEPLQALQPLHVAVRVEPRAARCAPRAHQALGLVQPQGLGMHADQLGGNSNHVFGGVVGHQHLGSSGCPVVTADRPEVGGVVGHQAAPAFCSRLARGFSPSSRANFSRASRWARLSFLGTTILIRASRSPRRSRLPPMGAPRPLTRSSTPSPVPPGTLSLTVSPSGVGTSMVAPTAASTNSTGTSTIRSSPRRVKTGEGVTWATTKRSPGSPPCTPASPLPLSRILAPSLTPGGTLTW